VDDEKPQPRERDSQNDRKWLEELGNTADTSFTMISDRTLRRVLRSGKQVALLGDLIRVLLAIVVAGAAGLCTWYYASVVRYMFGTLHMNDFGKFYYSAKAFLEGGPMYAPNPATAIPLAELGTRQFLNMNPPHFHLLILPLAFVGPLPAFVLWSLMNVVALVLSVWLIASELGLKWTWTGSAWALAGGIICSATGAVVVTGQVTFVLMLFVTLAWVAARHERWLRAAAYLGVLASIKPFLAIFWIYLITTRRLKEALMMSLAALAAVGSGLVVFGWSAYAEWVHTVAAVNWTWSTMNGSISGLVARTFGDGSIFLPMLSAPRLVPIASALLALTIGTVSIVVLTADRSSQSVDRAFTGLLLTALLVSPLGWVYYLWLIAGPAIALAQTFSLRPSAARDVSLVLALPGLLMPLPIVVLWREQSWAGATIGSIYTWTILALWVATVFDWRAHRLAAGSLDPFSARDRRLGS